MPTIVNLSGPLFDGRAERAADEAALAIEKRVADVGRDLVLAELPRVFRVRTGRYESHIRVSRDARGHVVNDGGRIPYGPWLEGLGSRNSPKTIFPGYWSFKRTTPVLDARAGTLGDHVLQPFLGKMQ